jgi:hypothetical protein
MIDYLSLAMGFIIASAVTLGGLFVLGGWVLALLVSWAMLEEIFGWDRKIGRFLEHVLNNSTH